MLQVPGMRALLILFSSVLVFSTALYAEEVSKEMRQVYAAYKNLQTFLTKPQTFEDSKNEKEIRSLLQNISKNFHRVDEMSSRYQKEPGFVATAELVHEMLDDSYKRFNEGNKSYALWRLRGLNAHCITCHATYNVKLQFEDNSSETAGLPPIDRADFYFSSRQFERASEAYLEIVEKDLSGHETFGALKKWLIVQTRVSADAKEAQQTLTRLLPKLELPVYEKEEIESWIASLKSWPADKKKLELADIERLIRQSTSIDPLSNEIDEVSLLRATALLHDLLPTLKSKEDRSRALYLLGFSYNKLRSFFIDELPEIYLRLSIEESPGSKNAKSAFELYKEIVTLAFTGSSGTEVPSDVRVNLMELYKKAHNIPPFSGKI